MWLSAEPGLSPARPLKPSISGLSLLKGRHLASMPLLALLWPYELKLRQRGEVNSKRHKKEQVVSAVHMSPAGDAYRLQLYVFVSDHSSGEQTNKARLWFSGAADVYLDPPNRSTSSWECVHACIYINLCVWGCVCVCLSVQRRTRGTGRRERVWRFVFSSAQRLRLVVYSLQFAVVTTSKLCRKNCNSEWKATFSGTP